ncbi:MAG TPA: hypothetical protein VFQ77_02720 [Pseudonocardiaceae bacterium]|jgi:hypothetical protein|nr:hypothetical protein [Pseudonocardiaceae bacterium]
MDYREVLREIRQPTAAARVPGRVRRTLQQVAHGHRRLTAVRHPLGFLCLPVQRRGAYGICVHLWTGQQPEPELTTSPMHSHSWDLVSYVLYGEVRNQLVQVTDEPAAPTHRLFEVLSDGDGDEIRPTARLVRCQLGPVQSTTAGDNYQLAAGEFHLTVVPGAAEAATVVLGHARADVVDLSLGEPRTRQHRVSRHRCTELETAQAAGLAVRRLTDIMMESARRRG